MSDPLTPRDKPPPVQLGRRIVLGLLAGVVAVAMLGYFGNRYDHTRSNAEVRRLERQLDEDDPNWRLADLEANREVIPEGENSARRVVDLTGRLPKGWPRVELSDQIELGKLSAPERPGKPTLELLDAELKTLGAIVVEARLLAEQPRGRYNITYPVNPIGILLNDSQESRRVATLLSFDALLRVEQGEIDAGLRSCRAIVNVGRAAGDEPLVVSQLIRCAILQQAIRAVERVLAQGEAGDAALVEMQALLALEDLHPTLRIARRGERAVLYDLCDKLASGRLIMSEMRRDFGARSPGLWEEWFGVRTGRRDQALALKVMTEGVEAIRLPEADQSAEERRLDGELEKVKFDSLIRGLMSNDIALFGTASRRKQALVRSLMALMAVERFRLQRRRWPDKLEEMMPLFLQTIPTDPFDGKSLRYTKVKDGVVVYSVGEDGHDDGGIVAPLTSSRPGSDQGVRLWDVKARRQPARPPLGEDKQP